MSMHLAFSPLPRTLPGTKGGTVRGALTRAWRHLRWVARVLNTRRDLQDIDPRMLQDLGISRAQADFELSRSPWQIHER
jgi:uncharacterized protein YjiS (DUF1127 family)